MLKQIRVWIVQTDRRALYVSWQMFVFCVVLGQFSSLCTSAVTSDHCTHCSLFIIVTSLGVFYLLLHVLNLVNALELSPSQNWNPKLYLCPLSLKILTPFKNMYAHSVLVYTGKPVYHDWYTGLCIILSTIFATTKAWKWCIFGWLIWLKLMGSSLMTHYRVIKNLPWLFTRWI